MYLRMRSLDIKLDVCFTMSKYAPSCHLTHLIYRVSDDPWNQTPADHAQWLEMFKKEVGII